LSAYVGLDDGNPAPDDYRESKLPSGKAISPQDAARCVPDYVRTGKFLRGVAGAIDAARGRFANETLRVLYAGCGPFAVLVLPIAQRWTADEVRFTLLDYHARSLDAARQVAEGLGVLDRIDDFLQADAATYRCPPDARPAVLIVETMQRALEQEPQVSITANLARQLRSGGLLVPELVELHLTLMNPATEFSLDSSNKGRDRRELGRVMSLDRAGYHCYDVAWPEAPTENLQPFIRTRIRVFGDVFIGDYESGLTVPAPLRWPQGTGQESLPGAGQRLHFDYRFEPTPQLVCTPLS